MKTFAWAFAAVALASTLSSCSSDPDENATTPTTLFSGSTTSIEVEIDYQTGAAPYEGNAGRLGDVWQISQQNVERIFLKGAKTVRIPNVVSQWESIGASTAANYTSDEILEIAKVHRGVQSGNGVAAFYVVFLDGIYQDADGPQKDVLGVSIGQTGVLAMFKPVIAQSETVTPGISKVLEQTTLVHELGHAFGLVNNGIPLTTSHQDTEHGRHCTNESCVMNWSSERLAGALNVARKFITTGTTIVFDDACLGDVDEMTK